MIVITEKSDRIIHCSPGDNFNFTVTDCFGSQVIITEEITVYKIIDFIASYRFALEDGTCEGFHLCGIFAESKKLPSELKNAIMFKDLTRKQKRNFRKTVGVKL